MPWRKPKEFSKEENNFVYVWGCCKCKFTAKNKDCQVAFNTASVHEVGHNFGDPDSVAFPISIAKWEEYERLKKQRRKNK